MDDNQKNNKAFFIIFIFIILILIRLASEIFFKLGFANRIVTFGAGGLILFFLFFLLFPGILIQQFKSNFDIIRRFYFILFYLLYLCLRTDWFLVDSVKMFLSELTVYTFFIFSVIYASKYNSFYAVCKKFIIIVFKISVLTGLLQILHFIYLTHPGLSEFMKARPATGFFAHQNCYGIIICCYGIFCLSERNYIWALLSFVAFLGSGNRSLIVYGLVNIYIIYLVITNKIIKKRHVFSALILALMIWSFLLFKYIGVDYSTTWGQDERTTAKTFVHRVNMWENLWSKLQTPQDYLIGKCLYQSYLECGKFNGDIGGSFPPHNDYLLLMFDTGIIGLMLFLGVILNFLSEIVISNSTLIIAPYILMLTYSLSGNLMFYSIALLLYVLLGLEIGKSIRNEKLT